MIDVSRLRSPAWRRVVDEAVKPSPTDEHFLVRLQALMSQVSAAKRSVLFSMPPSAGDDESQGEPRPVSVWPMSPGQQAPSGDLTNVEHATESRRAASAALSDGQSRVFSLDQGDVMYGQERQGMLAAVPVVGPTSASGAPQGRHAVVLHLDARSDQAMQATLAVLELLSGYIHGHRATQELLRLRQSTLALDLAARLIASINQAEGFKGASMQLCNDLQRQLGLDRVALGWVRGIGASGAVKVVAISDTEHIDRRMAMVRKLEGAMDECLDQEQAVLYPPPPETADAPGQEADVLLGQAITHAHKELASGDAKLRVVSVPIRADDRVVGVLTVESASEESPLNVRVAEWLQATADLVGPVLSVRRSDDRNLALRSAHSATKTGSWLVGPRHTVWKLAAIAALLLLVTAFVVERPYRVEAPVELRPRVQRVVSAPYSGVLESIEEGIEKNRLVEAGDILARMDTRELRLMAVRASESLAIARRRVEALMSGPDEPGLGAQIEEARAEAEAARAELDFYNERLEKAVIRAPISGVIIEGDLRERVGSAVSMGDAMFIVADIDELYGVASVDDRDIRLVERAVEQGLVRHSLATKADPGTRFDITIERVVRAATPKDGTNAFEVRISLDEPAPWLRPGMEGLVKLNTGDRSIASILSRRIIDTARLWLWM